MLLVKDELISYITFKIFKPCHLVSSLCEMKEQISNNLGLHFYI
jgi:hypothetical protein